MATFVPFGSRISTYCLFCCFLLNIFEITVTQNVACRFSSPWVKLGQHHIRIKFPNTTPSSFMMPDKVIPMTTTIIETLYDTSTSNIISSLSFRGYRNFDRVSNHEIQAYMDFEMQFSKHRNVPTVAELMSVLKTNANKTGLTDLDISVTFNSDIVALCKEETAAKLCPYRSGDRQRLHHKLEIQVTTDFARSVQTIFSNNDRRNIFNFIRYLMKSPKTALLQYDVEDSNHKRSQTDMKLVLNQNVLSVDIQYNLHYYKKHLVDLYNAADLTKFFDISVKHHLSTHDNDFEYFVSVRSSNISVIPPEMLCNDGFRLSASRSFARASGVFQISNPKPDLKNITPNFRVMIEKTLMHEMHKFDLNNITVIQDENTFFSIIGKPEEKHGVVFLPFTLAFQLDHSSSSFDKDNFLKDLTFFLVSHKSLSSWLGQIEFLSDFDIVYSQVYTQIRSTNLFFGNTSKLVVQEMTLPLKYETLCSQVELERLIRHALFFNERQYYNLKEDSKISFDFLDRSSCSTKSKTASFRVLYYLNSTGNPDIVWQPSFLKDRFEEGVTFLLGNESRPVFKEPRILESNAQFVTDKHRIHLSLKFNLNSAFLSADPVVIEEFLLLNIQDQFYRDFNLSNADVFRLVNSVSVKVLHVNADNTRHRAVGEAAVNFIVSHDPNMILVKQQFGDWFSIDKRSNETIWVSNFQVHNILADDFVSVVSSCDKETFLYWKIKQRVNLAWSHHSDSAILDQLFNFTAILYQQGGWSINRDNSTLDNFGVIRLSNTMSVTFEYFVSVPKHISFLQQHSFMKSLLDKLIAKIKNSSLKLRDRPKSVELKYVCSSRFDKYLIRHLVRDSVFVQPLNVTMTNMYLNDTKLFAGKIQLSNFQHDFLTHVITNLNTVYMNVSTLSSGNGHPIKRVDLEYEIASFTDVPFVPESLPDGGNGYYDNIKKQLNVLFNNQFEVVEFYRAIINNEPSNQSDVYTTKESPLSNITFSIQSNATNIKQLESQICSAFKQWTTDCKVTPKTGEDNTYYITLTPVSEKMMKQEDFNNLFNLVNTSLVLDTQFFTIKQWNLQSCKYGFDLFLVYLETPVAKQNVLDNDEAMRKYLIEEKLEKPLREFNKHKSSLYFIKYELTDYKDMKLKIQKTLSGYSAQIVFSVKMTTLSGFNQNYVVYDFSRVFKTNTVKVISPNLVCNNMEPDMLNYPMNGRLITLHLPLKEKNLYLTSFKKNDILYNKIWSNTSFVLNMFYPRSYRNMKVENNTLVIEDLALEFTALAKQFQSEDVYINALRYHLLKVGQDWQSSLQGTVNITSRDITKPCQLGHQRTANMYFTLGLEQADLYAKNITNADQADPRIVRAVSRIENITYFMPTKKFNVTNSIEKQLILHSNDKVLFVVVKLHLLIQNLVHSGDDLRKMVKERTLSLPNFKDDYGVQNQGLAPTGINYLQILHQPLIELENRCLVDRNRDIILKVILELPKNNVFQLSRLNILDIKTNITTLFIQELFNISYITNILKLQNDSSFSISNVLPDLGSNSISFEAYCHIRLINIIYKDDFILKGLFSIPFDNLLTKNKFASVKIDFESVNYLVNGKSCRKLGQTAEQKIFYVCQNMNKLTDVSRSLRECTNHAGQCVTHTFQLVLSPTFIIKPLFDRLNSGMNEIVKYLMKSAYKTGDYDMIQDRASIVSITNMYVSNTFSTILDVHSEYVLKNKPAGFDNETVNSDFINQMAKLSYLFGEFKVKNSKLFMNGSLPRPSPRPTPKSLPISTSFAPSTLTSSTVSSTLLSTSTSTIPTSTSIVTSSSVYSTSTERTTTAVPEVKVYKGLHMLNFNLTPYTSRYLDHSNDAAIYLMTKFLSEAYTSYNIKNNYVNVTSYSVYQTNVQVLFETLFEYNSDWANRIGSHKKLKQFSTDLLNKLAENKLAKDVFLSPKLNFRVKHVSNLESIYQKRSRRSAHLSTQDHNASNQTRMILSISLNIDSAPEFFKLRDPKKENLEQDLLFKYLLDMMMTDVIHSLPRNLSVSYIPGSISLKSTLDKAQFDAVLKVDKLTKQLATQIESFVLRNWKKTFNFLDKVVDLIIEKESTPKFHGLVSFVSLRVLHFLHGKSLETKPLNVIKRQLLPKFSFIVNEFLNSTDCPVISFDMSPEKKFGHLEVILLLKISGAENQAQKMTSAFVEQKVKNAFKHSANHSAIIPIEFSINETFVRNMFTVDKLRNQNFFVVSLNVSIPSQVFTDLQYKNVTEQRLIRNYVQSKMNMQQLFLNHLEVLYVSSSTLFAQLLCIFDSPLTNLTQEDVRIRLNKTELSLNSVAFPYQQLGGIQNTTELPAKNYVVHNLTFVGLDYGKLFQNDLFMRHSFEDYICSFIAMSYDVEHKIGMVDAECNVTFHPLIHKVSNHYWKNSTVAVSLYSIAGNDNLTRHDINKTFSNALSIKNNYLSDSVILSSAFGNVTNIYQLLYFRENPNFDLSKYRYNSTYKVQQSLKFKGWEFINQLTDTSSPIYKNFTSHFQNHLKSYFKSKTNFKGGMRSIKYEKGSIMVLIVYDIYYNGANYASMMLELEKETEDLFYKYPPAEGLELVRKHSHLNLLPITPKIRDINLNILDKDQETKSKPELKTAELSTVVVLTCVALAIFCVMVIIIVMRVVKLRRTNRIRGFEPSEVYQQQNVTYVNLISDVNWVPKPPSSSRKASLHSLTSSLNAVRKSFAYPSRGKHNSEDDILIDNDYDQTEKARKYYDDSDIDYEKIYENEDLECFLTRNVDGCSSISSYHSPRSSARYIDTAATLHAQQFSFSRRASCASCSTQNPAIYCSLHKKQTNKISDSDDSLWI